MGTVKYSGPVASFHCPTEATIRSLKVHFSPKQEGSGDPSPENVRPIVGWDGVEVYQRGKNLCDAATADEIIKKWPRVGAAYSHDIIGLPTNQQFILQANITKDLGQNISNCRLYCTGEKYSGSFINTATPAGVHTLINKPDSDGKITIFHNYIGLQNYQADFNNIQLEFGTTATSYEPYKGVTTNYEFGVLGKNKLNADAEQQAPDNTNMMPANKRIFTLNTYCVGMSWSNYYVPNNVTSYSVSNGTITVTNANVYGLGYPARVVPGQAYFLSATTTNGRAHIAYFSSDGTYISGVSTDILNKSFTIPNGVDVAVIVFYSASGEAVFSNVQLELGSSATAYEPYDPNKTVYGGWVDLISGEVQEEYNCIDLGTLDYTLRSNIGTGLFSANIGTQTDNLPHAKDLWSGYCSAYKYLGSYNDVKSVNRGIGYIYTRHVVVKDLSVTEDDTSAIKSALNGVILAYKLATPITYNLPPYSTELKTFLGQNNIWSNADYVEVEYDLHETQTILARKQFIIANQPHIVKPAAAPLQNFVTDMAAPLKNCKVYFSPAQEGTGDPSPDNVRPISGWTGIEVMRSPKNIFPKSLPEQLVKGNWATDSTSISAATNARCFSIYIGTNRTLKFTKTGTLTMELAFTDSPILDRSNTLYSAVNCTNRATYTLNSNEHPYLGISIVSVSAWDTLEERECILRFNETPGGFEARVDWKPIPIDWTDSAGTIYGGYVDLVNGELVATWVGKTKKVSAYTVKYTGESYNGYAFEDFILNTDWDNRSQQLCTIASFQYASNNGTTHFYIAKNGRLNLYIPTGTDEDTEFFAGAPLSAPIVYQLTPQQISTLVGINNIWSTANGDIEVKYWTH